MKIKTITCHDVYNYGASLQAYALQRYLRDLGHEVEIINYKPDYLSFLYDFMGVSPNWNSNFLLRWAYRIFRLPMRIRGLKRKKAFDFFTEEMLVLTSQRYESNEALLSSPPAAGAYIAGSDQIWNTSYKNGKDPAFYLDFAEKGARRLSYAASFSTKKIVSGYEDFVRAGLSKFDFITVREKDGLKILDSLGLKGAQVLDPVFLLSTEQWDELTVEIPEEEGYIFVYDLAGNPLLPKFAKKLAQKTGKKILAVRDNNKVPYADIVVKDAGPREFLSYLKHASYVVADSFHATAFALLYGKELFVFGRLDGEINSRMESLLSLVGCRDRYVTEENFAEEVLPLDFLQISERLAVEISYSKECLQKMLGFV